MCLWMDMNKPMLCKIVRIFLRLEELKLYIIKFEEDSIIKPKIYPINCTVYRDK